MKCPHCCKPIGLLSRTANKWSKDKACPHCAQPIRQYVSLKIAGLLFIPAIALCLLLEPFFVRFGLTVVCGTK